jgi:hypothetical protein
MADSFLLGENTAVGCFTDPLESDSMILHDRAAALFLFALFVPAVAAQEEMPATGRATQETERQEKQSGYNATAVNPILGSILPRDVPWRPLTGNERWRIYVNRTYLSVGAYFQAASSGAFDQYHNQPEEWGQGFDAYLKRAGASYLMIVAQNSLEHAGYAALGWEARYVRCRSDGAFRRLGHALAWDFVTYGRAGQIVPNIPRFVAAYGAAALPPLWNEHYKWTAEGIRKGNQSIFFAALFNIMREFAPEIKHALRRK